MVHEVRPINDRKQLLQVFPIDEEDFDNLVDNWLIDLMVVGPIEPGEYCGVSRSKVAPRKGDLVSEGYVRVTEATLMKLENPQHVKTVADAYGCTYEDALKKIVELNRKKLKLHSVCIEPLARFIPCSISSPLTPRNALSRSKKSKRATPQFQFH
jgi:hypothetical protein